MTDEKTKERYKSGGAVMPGAPTDAWTKRLRMLCELIFALVAGFFFGGTKLPLSVYPLGCALVAALPKNATVALVGIWLRCFYASALGTK